MILAFTCRGESQAFSCSCSGSGVLNIDASVTGPYYDAGLGGTLYSVIEANLNYDQDNDGDIDLSEHNGCIAIAGRLIVDQNLTINNCSNIKMQPCSEIVVNAHRILALTQNTISGCFQMWRGINDHIGVYTLGFGSFVSNVAHMPFTRNTFIGNGADQLLPQCDQNLANWNANNGYAGVVSRSVSFTIGTPTDVGFTNTFSGLRNGVIGENCWLEVNNASVSDIAGNWPLEANMPTTQTSAGLSMVVLSSPRNYLYNNTVEDIAITSDLRGYTLAGSSENELCYNWSDGNSIGYQFFNACGSTSLRRSDLFSHSTAIQINMTGLIGEQGPFNTSTQNFPNYNNVFNNTSGTARHFGTTNAQSIGQGSYLLNPSQAAKISAIAHQCPNVGGSAVYIARTIYQLIEEKSFNDETICEAEERKSLVGQGQMLDVVFGFDLFPNPASEHVTLAFQNLNNQKVNISLSNPSGQVVLVHEAYPNQYLLQVPLQGLPIGLYFCKVSTDNGTVTTRKLIIHR